MPVRTACADPQPPGALWTSRVLAGVSSGSRIGGELPSSTTMTSIRWSGYDCAARPASTRSSLSWCPYAGITMETPRTGSQSSSGGASSAL